MTALNTLTKMPGVKGMLDFLIDHHGVVLMIALAYAVYAIAELLLLLPARGRGPLDRGLRMLCHLLIMLALIMIASLHGLEYAHAVGAQQ